MSFEAQLVISICIVVGAIFALVGSIGLIRLPDLISRLHSPTKATTLGVGGMLIASLIYFSVVDGRLSVNVLLITLFLFLTAPISAHFIAKANLHLHCQDPDSELSLTQRPCGWRTFNKPDDEDGQ